MAYTACCVRIQSACQNRTLPGFVYSSGLRTDRVADSIMQEYLDGHDVDKNDMRFTRRFEIGAWILYFLIADFVGATSVLIERLRVGPLGNIWEPFVWEYTSGAALLLLIPLVLRLDRRYPLRMDSWKRATMVHIAATVPFSLAHTGIMVGLRKAIYSVRGGNYDFGNVPIELLYEFRKDLLTYFFVLGAVYAYRMVRANHTGADYDSATGSEASGQFLVKKRGQICRVSPDSVDWVEAAGNYVILHVGDYSHPLRDTMKGIAQRLGHTFCRVHRSTIVNLDRVMSTSPAQGGDLFVRLHNGIDVRCSRTMRGDFENQLASRTV